MADVVYVCIYTVQYVHIPESTQWLMWSMYVYIRCTMFTYQRVHNGWCGLCMYIYGAVCSHTGEHTMADVVYVCIYTVHYVHIPESTQWLMWSMYVYIWCSMFTYQRAHNGWCGLCMYIYGAVCSHTREYTMADVVYVCIYTVQYVALRYVNILHRIYTYIDHISHCVLSGMWTYCTVYIHT